MNNGGWIFMSLFFGILILTTIWSYRVLLDEEHIPTGPLEDEHHPLICEMDEKPSPGKGDQKD